MNFAFSHHRPRVERSRPDIAIGWTVRVTITDGETSIFNDISISCEAMPLDPPPRRADVDALVRSRLFLEGKPAHPSLVQLCALFEERRRYADVMNFPLSED